MRGGSRGQGENGRENGSRGKRGSDCVSEDVCVLGHGGEGEWR